MATVVRVAAAAGNGEAASLDGAQNAQQGAFGIFELHMQLVFHDCSPSMLALSWPGGTSGHTLARGSVLTCSRAGPFAVSSRPRVASTSSRRLVGHALMPRDSATAVTSGVSDKCVYR